MRILLRKSGLPHSLWPEALLMAAEHWDRVPWKGPTSPHERRVVSPPTPPLIYVGCAVIYLRGIGGSRYMPHFMPRGRLGLMVGYSTSRTSLVLDAEMFVRQGLRSIVQTRDFRMPVGDLVYPMRELNKLIDPIVDWSCTMACEKK